MYIHSGDLHIRPSDEWRVQPNLGVSVAVNTKLLSEQLQLNRKTIQRDLLVLRNKNLIQWIGSAKTGHWEVIIPKAVRLSLRKDGGCGRPSQEMETI